MKGEYKAYAEAKGGDYVKVLDMILKWIKGETKLSVEKIDVSGGYGEFIIRIFCSHFIRIF